MALFIPQPPERVRLGGDWARKRWDGVRKCRGESRRLVSLPSFFRGFGERCEILALGIQSRN